MKTEKKFEMFDFNQKRSGDAWTNTTYASKFSIMLDDLGKRVFTDIAQSLRESSLSDGRIGLIAESEMLGGACFFKRYDICRAVKMATHDITGGSDDIVTNLKQERENLRRAIKTIDRALAALPGEGK